MAERIGNQARQRITCTNTISPMALGLEFFVAYAFGSPRSAETPAIIAQEPTFITPFIINARTHGQRKVDPETRNKAKLKFNLIKLNY